MNHHARGATDICVLFAVSRCGPFCLARSVPPTSTHRELRGHEENTFEGPR
jgi:hypothetical protein